MLTSKKVCGMCKDLPEGIVVKGHDHRDDYVTFTKRGVDAGFTPEQIHFLAVWFEIKDARQYEQNER